MKTPLYVHLFCISTILPVFSANAMDNTTTNSNSSQHSSTGNVNQQVNSTNQNAAQSGNGYWSSLVRFAAKKTGAFEMGKELAGLRSPEERQKSLEIFELYSKTITDRSIKKIDHIIHKQTIERRDHIIELTENFIETFKKEEHNEQDILDASKILKLEYIDALVPAVLINVLRELVTEATTKRITNLNDLVEAIKPFEKSNYNAQPIISTNTQLINDLQQQNPKGENPVPNAVEENSSQEQQQQPAVEEQQSNSPASRTNGKRKKQHNHH